MAKPDRCSINAKLRRCVEPNYAVAQLSTATNLNINYKKRLGTHLGVAEPNKIAELSN